jgi:hypothetical protein
MNHSLRAGDVLVVEEDTVNPMSIAAVKSALKCFVPDIKLSASEPPPWHGGWQPVSKSGKIAKRISKWLSTQGFKLAPSEVSWIGNFASNTIIPKGTRIEITDRFDWNPGDFGDEDSCLFGGRRKTWGVLHALGGRAAKIYIPDRKPGRNLILDWEGKPYLFNFYGFTPQEGVGIWAAAAKENIVDVAFRVAGNTDYPIYINGRAAYTFGDEGYGAPVDVKSDEIYVLADPDITRCEHCYKVVATTPIYEAPRPPSYLCHECYELLKDSDQPRWANAYLVPVPGKSIKKQKKPAYSYADTTIAATADGTRFTFDIPEEADRPVVRRSMADWETWARFDRQVVNWVIDTDIPTPEAELTVAVREYLLERNMCFCGSCVHHGVNFLTGFLANNPHARGLPAGHIVSLAMREMPAL